MKKLLFKLILLLLLIPAIIHAQKSDRPSVGLVLSGGGAKGMAHIAVLKMLDSLQIPVDYIAGTSMGGILGALYAIGYSGQEIELISQRQDWNELFSDSPPRKYLSNMEKEDDSRFQFKLGLEGFTPEPPSGFISFSHQDISSSVRRLVPARYFLLPKPHLVTHCASERAPGCKRCKRGFRKTP